MAHAKFSYLRACIPVLWLGHAALLPAQSLVQQDLLPEVGSSWHMRALQGVPVEELQVEPVVWSFSNLIANDLFGATYTVVMPSQVPGSSAFPSADRAVRSTPDNGDIPSHTFYDVQDDATLELGTLGPVVSIFYQPPTMAYAYPLELGTSKLDEFCFASHSLGTRENYCGTTRITLDATGTLELPFNSYADVQRVITRRATALLGTTDSTIVTAKDWYAPGIPYPLVHVTTVTNPDGSMSSSGQLLDEASLVGMAEPLRMERLAVYPNPTNGLLNIPGMEGGDVQVHASDGRLVRTHRILPGDRRVLDLNELPNGVYHVALRDEHVQRSAMVVVAR